MDKINSGLFDVSKRKFDFFNVGIQPKLFVNVPKKTKVKGKQVLRLSSRDCLR